MTHPTINSPWLNDVARIERELHRLKTRSRWVSAVPNSEWTFDNTYDLISHPGDATSALVHIRLDPGRWCVFGHAMVHSITTHSTYTALRMVDEEIWDNTADVDDDLNMDLRNATTFATIPSATPRVEATFVLEQPRFVQLGITKVSGTNDINVDYARLFAIPG